MIERESWKSRVSNRPSTHARVGEAKKAWRKSRRLSTRNSDRGEIKQHDDQSRWAQKYGLAFRHVGGEKRKSDIRARDFFKKYLSCRRMKKEISARGSDKMDQRITVRLTPAEMELVVEAAHEEGDRKASSLIRRALIQFLKSKGYLGGRDRGADGGSPTLARA